ncbi:MAG: tetratricopeptide repeat protein [Dysgonamonadaceae bacterium]|jgi:tetratricopeptide (TPR) repeat protein|nr:tetratricopeptide repeat protein [Dysgonamonadaceae bacterium]
MKTKFKLSLVGLLLFGLTAFAGVNDKGIEYYSAGMLETARLFFLNQKDLTPADRAESYYYLGLIYDQFGMKKEMNEYFEKAYEIPETSYGYLCKAKLELAKNTKESLKTADDMLKKAGNLAKKDASVQTKIAEAYFVAGLTDKAEAALEKARKIDKTYSGIYMLEGDILMKNNQIGEATSRYENALYFNDKDKLAYLNLARVYNSINRKDLALDYLNKVLVIDPNFVPGYVLYGDIKHSQGRYKEAIEAYEKAITVPGAPLEVNERYAQSLYFDKQYDKSQAQIQNVLAKDPNNAVMHRLEAYTDYELGNYEGGLKKMEDFLSSVAIERHIYLDYLTMAQYYEQQKQYDKAVESFKKALELDQTKTELYKNMADAASSGGDYDNAIKYFEKYFELNTNYSPYDLYMYADLCSNAAGKCVNNYNTSLTPEQTAKNDAELKIYADKVIKANTDLIERAPDSYLGYYGRAKIYSTLDVYNLKKTGKMTGIAKPYYEEALKVLLANNEEGKLNRYIIDAYNYFSVCAISDDDKPTVIDYNKKILDVDPNNKDARDILDALKVKY